MFHAEVEEEVSVPFSKIVPFEIVWKNMLEPERL
jgi:hypothetical protein